MKRSGCFSDGARHSASMETAPEIFDRNALRVHRDRAAQTFCEYDFLAREMARAFRIGYWIWRANFR